MRAHSSHRKINQSRRRSIKRVVYSLGFVFLASLLFGVAGCKSTGTSQKEPQTIDDFLSAEKPGW